MDIFHKCPLSESKVSLLFFFFTWRDNGQLCRAKYIHLNIYIFFAVPSSQRRKTFLFLSNSLAAITSAEKRAQIKSHSVLAVGDLGTGLVFSAA